MMRAGGSVLEVVEIEISRILTIREGKDDQFQTVDIKAVTKEGGVFTLTLFSPEGSPLPKIAYESDL